MDKFKTMKCEDCGQEVRAKLLIDEKEFLDGYHGECSVCGWRYWPCEEPTPEPQTTDKEKGIASHLADAFYQIAELKEGHLDQQDLILVRLEKSVTAVAREVYVLKRKLSNIKQ